MKNLIHLHWIPFILAQPEVKTKFNHHLKIPIIYFTKQIWRPKVKNQYIPLEYSDNIDNELFDYSHYGKSVFKSKVDWKSHTRNGIITYNHVKNWNKLTKGLKISDTTNSESREIHISIIKKYRDCSTIIFPSTIQMTLTMGALIILIMVNQYLNQRSIGRHTPGMIVLHIIMHRIGTN